MLHIDCIYSFTRACYIYIVYIRSQEHVTYRLYIFVHKSMLHIYCIYSFTRACCIRLIIFVDKSMLHIDCLYSFTRACYIYIVYIRSQEHVALD